MRLFTIIALSAAAITACAQTNEWQDPEVNEVNRAPMHTSYFAYENADAALCGKRELSSNYMTLNGAWKFNWVENADARPTDFWQTGYDDGDWTTMQVPAMWELNGFGDPIYVNIQYPWTNYYKNN